MILLPVFKRLCFFDFCFFVFVFVLLSIEFPYERLHRRCMLIWHYTRCHTYI